MKRMILAGVAVLLLLFVGCISMPGTAPQEKGNETMGGTIEQQTTEQNEEQQTTEQNEEQQTTEQNEEQQTTEQNEGTIDNLADAIAQNVPLECTGTQTVNGEIINFHSWVKDKNFRLEQQFEGQTLVIIRKNDKTYIQAFLFGSPEEIGCDWIEMGEVSGESGTEGYSASMSISMTMDDEDLEEMKVDCNPSVFGDEKFDIQGNVCTLEDLMAAG